MKPSTPTLFRRDFTLVVIGQIISLFGSAILRFALPLYLLRQTGSPAQFGAVGAAALIPAVLCSPLGGAAADRLNKGHMMAALDFFTAALVLAFTLLLDRVPLLPLMALCLMLLYGIAGAYQPAVQASIPLLAGAEQLTQANAVINMVSTLAALLGPVAGGVLFGGFGIRPILWVSMGCFTLSAVMELFLRIPHTPGPTEGSALACVGRDLGESWRFIRRERPVFLSVMAVLALFNLVLSAALPGMFLTIALLARLVTWFFRRHYAVAFHGILGFVIASTLVIIPAEYTGAGEMALSALCAAAGFALAFFLAKMDKREETGKEPV